MSFEYLNPKDLGDVLAELDDELVRLQEAHLQLQGARIHTLEKALEAAVTVIALWIDRAQPDDAGHVLVDIEDKEKATSLLGTLLHALEHRGSA